MTNLAFALVLLAILCHACWNYVCKKSSGNLSVLWIGKLLALIVIAPFSLLNLPDKTIVLKDYPYLIATGVIHSLYFYFLAKLYKKGEISTVYPIARGIGVAGTAILGQLLLKEKVSSGGVLAILFICAGILIIGLSQLRTTRDNSLYGAVLVGLIISAYSINDKIGVKSFHPIAFITGQMILTIIFLLPVVFFFYRDELVDAWRTKKKYSIVTGIGSLGSYLLILFAFRLGPATYIVALRECSVVIGALFGFVFLKEQFTLKKLVGIGTVTAGMMLIYMVSK